MNKEIIDKIFSYYKEQDSEENNIVNKVALKKQIEENNNVDSLENSIQKRNALSDYKNLYYSEEIAKSLIEKGYIGIAKLISEVSGGSCYSESNSDLRQNNYNVNNFNFDLLDSILEIVKPEITYLEYRKIEKNLIKSEEFTEHEYYGNNRTYLVKIINLNKLFEALNIDVKLEVNPIEKKKLK